jgi:thiol-disulfide isomerase/thioredoxin
VPDSAYREEKGPARLWFAFGLASAGVAIALALYVYNGTGVANECPVQAEDAAAIDTAATGELAALNPTGQGRGFATLAFQDDAGQAVTMKDFAGKRLLVNFWASWCVPCRAEMPELDALAGKFNSDDFLVLPINLDIGEDGLQKARDFLAEGSWANLPLYADPSFKAFQRLQVEAVAAGLPATLVLDENGCELAVLQGPARWDTPDGERVIEALLGLPA